MKLLRETQQLNAELAQREQILTQHKKLGEERQLQDTRLQATIAQQGKLIDYLQGVGQETETRGLGRLKVNVHQCINTGITALLYCRD